MHVEVGVGLWAAAAKPYQKHDAMTDADTSQDWVRIVRGEYLEIPGLNLSRLQVQQMWGLGDVTCRAVLNILVEERFLRLTSKGRYVRAVSTELTRSS